MGNCLSFNAKNAPHVVDSSQIKLKSSQNLTIGLTEVQKEKFEFHWLVKNFSELEQEFSIESPEFIGGKDIGQKWFLVLVPKKNIEGEDWIGIHLKIKSQGDTNAYADFKISFTLNGITFKNSSINTREFSNSQCWGWDKYLNYPQKVENDQILIVCQVSLKNLVVQSQIIDEEYRNSMNPPVKNFDNLRSDFERLLKNPSELWDLRILVKGCEFKVQRAILSARSPVFSRMLSTRMIEAEDSIIKIDDFGPEIVESMLEFIYTGKSEIGCKNSYELFQISDKYDLPDLKDECEVELAKNLNFENALELFDIGNKYNASHLKSRAGQFIIKNVEEIVKHPEFKENVKNNNQLSPDILNAVLLDKKGQNKPFTITFN